jgi:hypothetical protein
MKRSPVMRQACMSAVMSGLALAVGAPRWAPAQNRVGHPDLENPSVFSFNVPSKRFNARVGPFRETPPRACTVPLRWSKSQT